MFIRLNLSCSSCRQPRLLDGAYQCTLTAGSLDEACGQLLCNSCSRAHSSATSHPCVRVVGLDSRVMAGVIDCPHRCGANLTPANYMKHARSYNLRELMCPMSMCRQKPFFWNTLASHLIDHHGFFNKNTSYEDYKEYILLAQTGLYFVWLGDAEAKPDLPSFMLKVYLHQAGPDGRPRKELGHYLSPHPARVMDVIHLCVIPSVANVNITQQNFYLRVLIEDRA
ncbi:hypothetical protein PVAP13_7KG075718 [Panicum virgatum]|uniref:Uncharacterized protein n=1 Tax=Panicum virgatum TaxID=38727 RepID=A0A8T0QAG1_PANVG|nr:hypothetical protein PVAP13_7KG075718 [Panicum virgatum]